MTLSNTPNGKWEKSEYRLSDLNEQNLEIIEAQKLFCFDSKKFEILIHPESLVHAIIKFKNGLSKFIYHETSMIVPLANAIFNNRINIDQFYKTLKKNKNLYKNLSFKKIDIKKFPLSRLKDKINDHPSSAIIINAANEILVDQFLKKNINFLDINKFILSTLRDRNFRKYAIREPKNIDQIYKIDNWARTLILKKIEKKNDKIFKASLIFFFYFSFLNAEVVKKIEISGNKRISGKLSKFMVILN